MPSEHPVPTVDIVIEVVTRPGAPAKLLLIRRGHEPHGWALPGGFVDRGETLAEAARREALEETGLTVRLLELFHCYSDPARDPRLHTVSAVFLARAEGEPRAGDDAASCHLFAPDEIPEPMCFDHRLIVDDVLRYRQTGTRPPPDR